MKLNSIKISNILSFEEKENIDDIQPIVLDDVNILIGPNGAGKSNFLEILNQIFKTILIKPYTLQHSDYVRYKNDNNKNAKDVITPHPNIKTDHLSPNNQSNSGKQTIVLHLELNKNDRANLKFIYDNFDLINNCLTEFCKETLQKTSELTWEDIKKSSKGEIELIFVRDADNKEFSRTQTASSPSNDFIVQYLTCFDLISKAIVIHNLEKKSTILPLKETFFLIGCYRNYSSIKLTHHTTKHPIESITKIDTDQKLLNTIKIANANHLPIFDLVLESLARKHSDAFKDDYKKRNELIEKDSSFLLINEQLKLFLGIELRAHPPQTREEDVQKQYRFTFVSVDDKTEKQIEQNQLSAGQKSIMHFIFSVFGSDIEDGIIMIDEPELHLHPQIQKQYLEIIDTASKKRGIQFVIVTHSPIFTSPDVISSLHRFYKNSNGYTKIAHNPNIGNKTAMKELVRILTYTNASKIFFADKVVLVEGENDEYFYKAFLDRLLKEDKYKDYRTQAVEIISITGKDQKKVWLNFLESFKIKACFIGDWDNVVEYNLIQQKKINELKQKFVDNILEKIADKIKDKGSLDAKELIKRLESYLTTRTDEDFESLKNLLFYLKRRHTPLGEIVQHFKKSESDEFEKMVTAIEGIYSDRVYILKAGELEDYLGVDNKKLSTVIELCKEGNLEKWYKSKSAKQKEIKEIFINILEV